MKKIYYLSLATLLTAFVTLNACHKNKDDDEPSPSNTTIKTVEGTNENFSGQVTDSVVSTSGNTYYQGSLTIGGGASTSSTNTDNNTSSGETVANTSETSSGSTISTITISEEITNADKLDDYLSSIKETDSTYTLPLYYDITSNETTNEYDYRLVLQKYENIKLVLDFSQSTIENLDAGLFDNTQNIRAVILPPTLKFIGSGALNGKQIESITFLSDEPPTLDNGAFADDNNVLNIYVPSTSVDKYISQWSEKFSYKADWFKIHIFAIPTVEDSSTSK